MHRLTAKLMLLVFFAGTFTPLAGAMALPAEHCARPPMGVRTESVPSCPHHHAAAPEQPASASSLPTSGFRSNECCNEHACCRSTVRSQWAQVRLQTIFQQADRADDRLAILQTQVRSSDSSAYHSVRAPPSL